MIKAITVFIALFLTTQGVVAQPYLWQNFTNKDQITSLEYYADFVWVTTSGGVVRINPQSGERKSYINNDGLGSTVTNFSVYDDDRLTYFGSNDGFLTQLEIESESFTVTSLRDREGEGLKLNNAVVDSQFLWIASEVGVIKFDRFRHGGEVKETYRTLGVFSADLAITDIVILDGKVYAATRQGVAFADSDNPFLLDPAEWSNVTIFDFDLTAGDVTALAIFDDRLYAGTDSGLVRFESDSQFVVIEETRGERVFCLHEDGEFLYIVAGDDNRRMLFELSQSSIKQVSTTGVPSGELNAVTTAATLFLGTENSGVYVEESGAFTRFDLPGPAANELVGGGIRSDGSVVAVSRFQEYSLLSSNIWQQFDISNRENFSAMLDSDGAIWVGTFGDGVYRIPVDDHGVNFSVGNSPIFGVDETFSIVIDTYEDPSGNIWMASSDGEPYRPLLVFNPHDSLWAWWEDPIILGDIKARAVAAGDSVAAIGFENSGVAILHYGDSPFDLADDQLALFGRNRALPSNTVNDLIFDRDDVLWVGTNLGLAYFDLDIEFFFPVALPAEVSTQVTALVVDSRNNLWVGTSEGLAFISDNQQEKFAFTTENSDLISDDIRSLSFDSKNGWLLVFTSGGLSILDYNLVSRTEGNKVVAYPNPFEINAGADEMLRFNIDQRGDIRILTIAGDLVRLTTVNAGWDGRNDNGELVASGVYLFYLMAEDGNEHTGKIFVLRR